eukprot:1149505-Pelagomonas_calceolata.AAC.1
MDGGEVQCMEGGQSTGGQWMEVRCNAWRSKCRKAWMVVMRLGGMRYVWRSDRRGHVNTHREHIAGWCHAESKGQNECMKVPRRIRKVDQNEFMVVCKTSKVVFAAAALGLLKCCGSSDGEAAHTCRLLQLKGWSRIKSWGCSSG